jgi:hypothetical protein
MEENVAVPTGVLFTRNVTDPVIFPRMDEVTVAVSSVVPPSATEFGAAVTVMVVGAAVTASVPLPFEPA